MSCADLAVPITVASGGAVASFTGTVQGRDAAEYFLDTCSGCHGADRRGATGPALLPERLTQPDDYYTGVITNGKPGPKVSGGPITSAGR